MSDSSEDSSYVQRLSELQEAHEKLIGEKQGLLQRLDDSERLKFELREIRHGTKKLTTQRDRLRTLVDSKQRTQPAEQLHEGEESSGSEDEDPRRPPEDYHPRRPPEDEHLRRPPEASTEHSGNPNPSGRELGAEMASKTEASALRMENENLVKQNRKLEQTVNSLVQELASLGNKYEGLNSLLQRLDAENQRLALVVNQQHTAQHSTQSVETEEVALLKAQLRTYVEDFNVERSEREATHALKERLKQELCETKAAIRGYQEQLRDVPQGRYTYRPYDQGLARRDPYYGLQSSQYRDVDRDLLNFGMTRSYSGGYIGPSARDVYRRGARQRKAFLTPDMTAVVDRDVPDAGSNNCTKSI